MSWAYQALLLGIFKLSTTAAAFSGGVMESENDVEEHLKVLCLNVLGGIHDESRYRRLIDFINQQDPDILGLLELNGWEGENFSKLQDFLLKTQFEDHIFCKANSDFNLALFSKKKFLLKENLPEKMGHGLIRVQFPVRDSALTIFLTHLTPGTEDARLRELKVILTYVHQNELTLIMGDLNSLSPIDPYQDEALLEILKKSGIQKFGMDVIRKDLIQKLLNEGFKDAAEVFHSSFQATVPTPLSSDPAHATRLRLDYIFVSPNVAPHLKHYEVIQSEETDRLSDHYPVAAELAF